MATNIILQPGEIVLEKYQIVQAFPPGGMGIVYLVNVLDSGYPMVMKMIRPDLVTSSWHEKKFLQEAEFWIKMEWHENVVNAFHVHTVGEALAIFSEYVPGSDLGKKLKSANIEYKQALEYAIQICHGMVHLLKNGILVHRDLKPSNILLMTYPGMTLNVTYDILKIGDYGLASFLPNYLQNETENESESSDTVLGTPAYIAPEQWSLDQECKSSSDIYSLGIILYELVTGKHPYQDLTNSWRERHQTFTPPHPCDINSELPKDLGDLILNCMAKSPADRPESFPVLSKQLEDVFADVTGHMFLPIPYRLLETRENELLRKSQAYISLGGSNLSKSMELLDAFLANHSNSPANLAMAWGNKGYIYMETGDTENAKMCFEKALKINPSEDKVWHNLGILTAKEDTGKALEYYDKALSLNPENGKCYYDKGKLLEKLGRSQEAFECYRHALDCDESDPDYWMSIASMLVAFGQIAVAKITIDDAIKHHEGFPPLWYYKGRCFQEEGDFKSALLAFSHAVELSSRYAAAITEIGYCLNNMENYREAIKYFERTLTLIPNDEAALVNMGYSFEKLYHFDQAIQCYDKILTINPRAAAAWQGKGASLTSLGRYKDAERCFQRVFSLPATNDILSRAEAGLFVCRAGFGWKAILLMIGFWKRFISFFMMPKR